MPKSVSSKSRSRGDHTRLSQTVCSRLSRAIIAGDFEPGTRVSEPSLSAMLGVSRAPIREALIELELRGLVEFDPTGHTRIPTLTPRDIEEIHAVRLMIDPVAAGLAAGPPSTIRWSNVGESGSWRWSTKPSWPPGGPPACRRL